MGDPMRVLVVDDEPAIRHAVEAMLVDEGFAVATAADGAAALALLDTFRPDAILLDLRMPIMDGYAFLTAYRTHPGPRAAVIVCSTAASSAAVLALGATAHLRKPFDIDDLIGLIERLRTKTAPAFESGPTEQSIVRQFRASYRSDR
jgi:two-component system, chemotaxis family, chemotaxis protein CheY